MDSNEDISRKRQYRRLSQIVKPSITGVWVIITAAILAAGLYMTAKMVIGGLVMYKTVASGGITATGSATRDFLSDQASWSGSYSYEANTTREAYEVIKGQKDIVRQYLLDNGFNAGEITFNAVSIEQKYRTEYSDNGAYLGSFPDGYRLTQSISVVSDNVDRVEDISRKATELIDDGVDFISYSPSFFYTQLNQLKLEMIEQATQNAKRRIDIIADNSGSMIGKLLNANLGVFQVTARNSASEEFTSYGILDTSSKWKTASVTVKLYYAIEK